MPTVECYKDIGALGARLDEMERARLQREEERDRARQQRDEKLDKRLDHLEEQLLELKTTRSQLEGIVWAVRIIFGGVGLLIVYLVKEGSPEWFKQLFR